MRLSPAARGSVDGVPPERAARRGRSIGGRSSSARLRSPRSRPAAARRCWPRAAATTGGAAAARARVPSSSRDPTSRPRCRCSTTSRRSTTASKPESGTLKLYNYAEYINPDTIAAFEDEYDVKVEITTFTTMDEAVEKLRTGSAEVRRVLPYTRRDRQGRRGQAAPADQPVLHHQLRERVARAPGPVLRQGSLYTVPYTLYTTGVAFRRDRVATPPAALENGYDILWDPAYKGRIYILNDDREALGMALIRSGVTDVNTEDPAQIEQAARRPHGARVGRRREDRHRGVPAHPRRHRHGAPGVVG